ncbi:MAG: hypothetical protein KJ690_02865 [Alphaproteobacteria bacterium]|nr:hypothetical protein [Alphaproteobacteria bacterium]MBU4135341.1 hypothetical protein [Alphaproteobacteria bacterium]
MLAVVFAAMLQQQAATAQVVWETPAPPPAQAAAPAEAPDIPDYARTDPYGYERAECSPLVRRSEETMEACQQRVRAALAANLGPALPAGLAPGDAAEHCRQEADGDRYALQCGAPSRSVPAGPDLRVRSCTTRPRATEKGAVTYEETCTVGGEDVRDEGLRIRLGGED